MVGQWCEICHKWSPATMSIPRLYWKREKLVLEDLGGIDEELKKKILYGKMYSKFICTKHAPRMRKWKKAKRKFDAETRRARLKASTGPKGKEERTKPGPVSTPVPASTPVTASTPVQQASQASKLMAKSEKPGTSREDRDDTAHVSTQSSEIKRKAHVPRIKWKRRKLAEFLSECDPSFKRDILEGCLERRMLCTSHAPGKEEREKKFEKVHVSPPILPIPLPPALQIGGRTTEKIRVTPSNAPPLTGQNGGIVDGYLEQRMLCTRHAPGKEEWERKIEKVHVSPPLLSVQIGGRTFENIRVAPGPGYYERVPVSERVPRRDPAPGSFHAKIRAKLLQKSSGETDCPTLQTTVDVCTNKPLICTEPKMKMEIKTESDPDGLFSTSHSTGTEQTPRESGTSGTVFQTNVTDVKPLSVVLETMKREIKREIEETECEPSSSSSDFLNHGDVPINKFCSRRSHVQSNKQKNCY